MSVEDQRAATAALFKAIASTTAEVADNGDTQNRQAEALRDLALAYRYVAGGTQPGTSVVERR